MFILVFYKKIIFLHDKPEDIATNVKVNVVKQRKIRIFL